MKTSIAILGILTSISQAAIVALTPATINAGNTATTSFTSADTFVIITPTLGGVNATFNADATRLGMDDNATNAGAFNDPDVNPNNGNEEGLQFAFVATAGLSQITYDFSRADGPGASDGVIISGFTTDPMVTFSIANVNLFAVYNASTGTVRLNIPGTLFSGTLTAINFNPAASAGQTLLMSVTDTNQAGAQFAIRGISYDNATAAVPEPSSLALLSFSGLALLRRR
jgi:hypothetical protein